MIRVKKENTAQGLILHTSSSDVGEEVQGGGTYCFCRKIYLMATLHNVGPMAI